MQQRRLVGAASVVVAGVLFFGAAVRAEMETPQQSKQQVPSTGLGSDPMGLANPDSAIDAATAERMKHQQEKAGLNDRHQRMVADADKLLQMATELKMEVDTSTKNETSVSAYNKADAIERLAHDVKQRLRN